MEECEVFVVPRVITILGAQLNRELQAFHRALCFAREAIQRGHGIDDVVGLRRGLQGTVKMHARFVPAAKIHQGYALRVMVLGGFWSGRGRLGKPHLDAADVDARPVAKLLVRPFKHLLKELFGALKLLLLNFLQAFFVEFQLLLEGGVGLMSYDLGSSIST